MPGIRSGTLLLLVLLTVSCRTNDLPEGWERDDYIAYLAISDFLRQPSPHREPSVVCVVNGIGAHAAYYDKLPDPSLKLLDGLTTEFAGSHTYTFRPGSACHDVLGVVRERTTGRDAMYISVSRSRPEQILCGGYEVDWHHAVLWGGGAYYAVNLDQEPLVVNRSEICFIGE